MSEFLLVVPKGRRKNRKRVGRGAGSGTGSTAGKGSKGQNARSGGGVRPGFEGGQMPLFRRIARRGFSNARFKKEYTILNFDDLGIFKSGETVSKEALIKRGIIKKSALKIKLLGRGEINKKLNIELDKISKNAQVKIKNLGGEVKELEGKKLKGKNKRRVKEAQANLRKNEVDKKRPAKETKSLEKNTETTEVKAKEKQAEKNIEKTIIRPAKAEVIKKEEKARKPSKSKEMEE
jgi:large subunit ribosomal protein L15